MRSEQRGWVHDEGHPAGLFHTYDNLDVGYGFAPRKVHVFLPRHYAAGERYPVVYFHDGDTSFWPGGVGKNTWDVGGVLSVMAGRVAEVIAVAIHPLDRNAEYTHVDWSHGHRTWGRLIDHADYVADGVKGFIDANYPTVRSASANAIVGSSHGGLAAFWTATRRPDAFGNAGCFSPSFFSGLDSLVRGPRPTLLASSALVAGAAAVLGDPSVRPRLWLCWGMRRDGGEHNAVVEALAARRGAEMAHLLEHTYGYRRGEGRTATPTDAELFVASDPNHGHDEDAWRVRFGWMMRALFPR